MNKTQKEYRILSKTQVKKPKVVDDDLSLSEIKTLERIESGRGRFSKTYTNPHELIEDLHNDTIKKKNVVKTKMDSPPLSDEEIADIKKARKSKGKIFKTPEKLIQDLHANMSNRQKASV